MDMGAIKKLYQDKRPDRWDKNDPTLKIRPCLKCDKPVKTTIHIRLCWHCTEEIREEGFLDQDCYGRLFGG